jgi:phage terminase small subunit
MGISLFLAAVYSRDDTWLDNVRTQLMALSKKRQAFINEYLQCFNATEAAIKAGYSKKTAHSIGWEILRIPEVADFISKRLGESAMSADEVLLRLAEHARSDYSKYIKRDGYVDLGSLILDGKGHLIKGIKETKYGTQVEFYDSQSALVTLAKHHGLLTDRIQQQTVNLDFDVNTLSVEQIKRLANGEDLVDILAD